MSTYIKKLKVLNAGIFDRLEIDFSPRVNILYGSNSIGKTSILRFLTYCFSNSDYISTRFRKGASFAAYGLENDESKVWGASDLVEQDTAYQTHIPYSWHSPNMPDDSSQVSINLPFSSTYHMLAIGALRSFSYIQIRGMEREPNSGEALRRYLDGNSRWLDSSTLPNIKQWLINRYFVVDKDWAKFERANWQTLQSKLQLIAPSDAGFCFSRIERDLEPIFVLNGRECYLEELSGGYKSVLSIILTIISWCEETNEGERKLIEEAEGTVLIDEIDAHLHPEWQAIIVKSLSEFFPKLQFIITTHSPYVIGSAGPNQLIHIEKDHNGEVCLSPDERSYGGWTFNFILRDLMGVRDLDDYESLSIIKLLDSAIEKKDIEQYEKNLCLLKKRLHRDDPTLMYYQFQKAKIIRRDHDSSN